LSFCGLQVPRVGEQIIGALSVLYYLIAIAQGKGRGSHSGFHMAPISRLLCCTLTGLNRCQNNSHSQDVHVDLVYGRYAGSRLGNGVNQFLGMRYAAAPLGDLRWRAPQDPPVESGLHDANTVGPRFFAS
jgi:hypothetical protein